MALTREQAQQKVKEILNLAKNEKKLLTYQDVMNKLSELDIDADAIDAVFETLEAEGINVVNASEDEVAVVPEITGAGTAGFAACSPARASKGKLSPGQPVAFTSLWRWTVEMPYFCFRYATSSCPARSWASGMVSRSKLPSKQTPRLS